MAEVWRLMTTRGGAGSVTDTANRYSSLTHPDCLALNGLTDQFGRPISSQAES